MEAYRKYSAEIPEFLRNRPKFFLEHCVKRLPPVCPYLPLESITAMPSGEFRVPSTNDEIEYCVKLDNDIPKCTCPDWNRYHLPCKHMISIFHHFPGYSWEFLSTVYTDCPHFNLDKDIIRISDVPKNPSVQQLRETEQCVRDISEPVGPPQLPRVTCAANKRIQCIQLVKDISSSLYHITDQTSLEPVLQKLREVSNGLQDLVPKENGLPLRLAQKKSRQGSRQYRQLPSRRKRRKCKSSIGQRASKGVSQQFILKF